MAFDQAFDRAVAASCQAVVADLPFVPPLAAVAYQAVVAAAVALAVACHPFEVDQVVVACLPFVLVVVVGS